MGCVKQTKRKRANESPQARETLIHPRVIWRGRHTVGPFCVIGEESKDAKTVATVVGAGALIRSHTVIYAGNVIGRRFQTGHGVLIRHTNVIGDDVSIGSHSVVEHNVRIGHRVRLHSHVLVPEYCVLAADAWLGPHVVLTNAKYPRSPRVKKQLRGVYVGRGAKIGANATILPGVRIGREALVGAGAVVTKDVPPRAVVVGNPARIINTVSNLPY